MTDIQTLCNHNQIATNCSACWCDKQPKCEHNQIATNCSTCWCDKQPTAQYVIINIYLSDYSAIVLRLIDKRISR